MRVLIFAGTTEGRQLCTTLAALDIAAQVFVATDYGALQMPALNGITVHTGRLSERDMNAYFCQDDLVIDATHPYATAVSHNLQVTCKNKGAEYLRLVRPETIINQSCIEVPGAAAAAEFLNTVSGRAFITTGSKELSAFTQVRDYQNRLFVRVLPSAKVLRECEALGFQGRAIVAMQGPFSKEINIALFHQFDIQYVVTKDGGQLGGTDAKISAAAETGATVILITRPNQEQGKTLEQIIEHLQGRLWG